MSGPQSIIFALVEDFSHIAFACAVEPLRIANLVSGRTLYNWSFASADGKTATSSNGAVTLVHCGFDDLPPASRLFVLSGINMQHRETGSLVKALRRERARGTRIGGLCSGAHILAKAGFLDGMRAAIHWEYHDSFSEQFPRVQLVRNVFVPDEKIITASGGTATADLMLHLIEQEHGYDLSVAVSDQMVYNAVRDASAAQRVSFQSRAGIRNKHLARAIEIMRSRIDDPISPSVIADELGITTRQIERLFGIYLSTSPKKYFMAMRLERARHLLLQSEAAVTEIAMACGFGTASHFSRSYRSAFGISPMMQRCRLS